MRARWASASHDGDIDVLCNMTLEMLTNDETDYDEYVAILSVCIGAAIQHSCTLSSGDLSRLLVPLDSVWRDVAADKKLRIIEILSCGYRAIRDIAAQTLLLDWIVSFESISESAKRLLVLVHLVGTPPPIAAAVNKYIARVYHDDRAKTIQPRLVLDDLPADQDRLIDTLNHFANRLD